MNFSTEEHVVGTWVDGRPVYEKTIVRTDADSFEIADDIDIIVDIFGSRVGFGGNMLSLMYAPKNTAVYDEFVASGYFDKKSYRWVPEFGETVIINLRKVYYTFQYTKTTDEGE